MRQMQTRRHTLLETAQDAVLTVIFPRLFKNIVLKGSLKFTQSAFNSTYMTRVAARAGADASDPDSGKYKEVRDEKELLSMSVREPNVVIHFAKPEFRRCRILDRHLEVSLPI